MNIIISNKAALDLPKQIAKNTSLSVMFLAAKIFGINPKSEQYLNILDRAIVNCVKNN